MNATAFLFGLMVEPCTDDLNCGMQSNRNAPMYMAPCFWSLLLVNAGTLDASGLGPFCASQFTGGFFTHPED